MKIYLIPQFSPNSLTYSFRGDAITVDMDGNKDTFDFTGMPDGELELDDIETTLEHNPIMSAKKIDGILSVELLNWLDRDATVEEKFPEWMDSEDYIAPNRRLPIDG